MKISYCQFPLSDISSFEKLIDQASKIVLLPHSRADGDALGSCLAMQHFLNSLGKKTEVVCPDEPKEVSLPSEFTDFKVGSHSFKPDLIIACDAGSKGRIYFPDDFTGVPLVNIDHHASNPLYGDLNFVDGTAASACEVIVALLFNSKFKTFLDNKLCVEALLFGLLDDSQLFKIEPVSQDTLTIASRLIEAGADFKRLKKLILPRKTHKILRSWANALAETKPYFSEKLLVFSADLAYFDQKQLKIENFDGFINTLADFSASELVLVLIEVKPNVVKGSFRSKKHNILPLAEMFNNDKGRGGGHPLAAGLVVSGKNIEEVESLIVNKARSLGLYL